MALDDERSFAEAEHALDGFDERGLGVNGFGLGGFFWLSVKAGEDLAGGIFFENNGGGGVVRFGKAAVGHKCVDVCFREFFEAAAGVGRVGFGGRVVPFV